MNVEGCVKLRSSAPSFRGGAPGESVIHQLNPQREKKILAETGWRRLEPGSLNLCVDDETVDRLLKVKELIFELPDEINYPDGWQHIPQRRGGYKYYLATTTVRGKIEEVLVRRAIHPVPGPGRIELFAAVNLRNRLGLQNGEAIQVTVF